MLIPEPQESKPLASIDFLTSDPQWALAMESSACWCRGPFAPAGGGSAQSWRASMSQVNNVNVNAPIQKIVANPVQKSIPAGAAPVRASDRLELSGASHLLAS